MTTNETETEALYRIYRDACTALDVAPAAELAEVKDGTIRALYESVKGSGEPYPPGDRGYTLSLESLTAGALWDESSWMRRCSRAQVAAVLQTRPDPGWVEHKEEPATDRSPRVVSFDEFNVRRHGTVQS